MRSAVAVILLGGAAALIFLPTFLTEPSRVEIAPPSDFLRFVERSDGGAELQTALDHYRDERGVDVALVAAVHVADVGYYARLEGRFARFDALLYEMIKPEGVEPVSAGRSASLLSAFQRGLRDLLDLEFQLDAIDYTRENFVHADMDPDTFFRLQRRKGENLLTLLWRATVEAWRQQAAGEGEPLDGFSLLVALFRPDRARALKLLLARQFGRIESMLAGIEGDPGEGGSVILSGRNRVVMSVLRRQIAKGRRRLGIFYGAGHMPDLERRLREMGFRKVSGTWLTAWNIPPPE